MTKDRLWSRGIDAGGDQAAEQHRFASTKITSIAISRKFGG